MFYSYIPENIKRIIEDLYSKVLTKSSLGTLDLYNLGLLDIYNAYRRWKHKKIIYDYIWRDRVK